VNHEDLKDREESLPSIPANPDPGRADMDEGVLTVDVHVMGSSSAGSLNIRNLLSVSDGQGFTLIEMLIAMFILTFGLLAAGQMMCVAMGSSSLARSKGNAAIVAQDKLEFLADLYRRNPTAGDLSIGAHGPEQVQILNPINAQTLNRFNVAWTVVPVPDPRPGFVLNARQVTATATPIGQGNKVNNQVSLNKVVNITAIFSARVL
jgi:prepilin-type N-terminal cleavage/methylation domain-containing protein